MKIFIIFLILGMSKTMAEISECEKLPVPLIMDPMCGILPDCYVNAFNRAELEIHSCMRKEKGLQDFSSTKKGPCPRDKPPCANVAS